MSVDIFEFLLQLDQKRYRSVILHAPPEKGPAIARFCQKLCLTAGGKYLDLLDYFIQTPALSQTIDIFSPEKFRSLLIEQSRSQSLLVVDRADFILDTWRRPERLVFYRLFTDQWDSYREGMKAKLVVCLQTSQEILALPADSSVQGHIRQLTDFNDIA